MQCIFRSFLLFFVPHYWHHSSANFLLSKFGSSKGAWFPSQDLPEPRTGRCCRLETWVLRTLADSSQRTGQLPKNSAKSSVGPRNAEKQVFFSYGQPVLPWECCVTSFGKRGKKPFFMDRHGMKEPGRGSFWPSPSTDKIRKRLPDLKMDLRVPACRKQYHS